ILINIPNLKYLTIGHELRKD
ncbi:hypothetical protein A5887_000687, partial [Enterococcus faecium]